MKICPQCKRCYEDAQTSCSQTGHGSLTKDRPGTRIIAQTYQLERLLGSGAMGSVYQSTQLNSTKVRAIKVLKPEYINKDPQAIERFRNEFQTGDLVGHQNVVRVYDYFELNKDETCIVMEFIEGESLRDYMRRQAHTQLPLHEAIMIASQIAIGIEALHRIHVLHCDLKPENIMLTKSKQDQLLVKVVDFGLAKPLKALSRPRYSHGAQVKEFAGTLLYTSPENCRGEDIDERADIYSLGIILYEMLAGQPPFSGRPAEVERQHKVDTPAPLSTFRSDIPLALAELVIKALNKNPKARPQSAKYFADRLHNIGLGIMEEATPDVATGQPPVQPRVVVKEQSQTASTKPRQKKRKLSQKSKAQESRFVELPHESYLKIDIMKPTKGTDKSLPLVRTRHELNLPIRTRTKIVVIALAAALMLGLGGGAYLFYKYEAGQFGRYVAAGRAHLEKNEYDLAIEAFSKAIELDSTQFEPYYHRGVARSKKGDQDGALKDYSEAIKRAPEYVMAYQNRASIYLSKADYEKAIEDYTKILFLAPNADIYKLRGDARLYLKDYDHAITDYTQAIQLDPNNPNILDGRSTAYTKRKGTGDRELANADRKKAAQLAR